MKNLKTGIALFVSLIVIGSAVMLGAGASDKINEYQQGQTVTEIKQSKSRLESEMKDLNNELEAWKNLEFRTAEERNLLNKAIANYQEEVGKVSGRIEANICARAVFNARLSVLDLSSVKAEDKENILKFCAPEKVPDFLEKEVIVKTEIVTAPPLYTTPESNDWAFDMIEDFNEYYSDEDAEFDALYEESLAL